MRIIFSRKGFDSRYGAGCSPILPDGTMVSLPIPESGSGLRYADIGTPRGPMLNLMRELGMTRVRETAFIALDEHTEAHLDPDLYRDARARHTEWRPVFGQSGAAQGHLANQGVRAGDLFIFYGTFRHTKEAASRLRFVGNSFHAVFAYMRVGSVVRINGSTALPWCAEHPHLLIRDRTNNTLYIAGESLDGLGLPSGSATLPYDGRRILSVPGSISTRRLPRFFHPAVSQRGISYHVPEAWSMDDGHAILRTKSPGQEYVVEATDDMIDWCSGLLR